MTYRYDNVKIDDLAIVATRISRLIGIMPTGLNDSGDSTEIMFSIELTTEQKTALDAFMAGTNLDLLPPTTNTAYAINDIEAVKSITGLDFDIYPTKTGLVIQFTKVLTTQEKNAFRNAVGSQLVQL
jgi:hypothetical protein